MSYVPRHAAGPSRELTDLSRVEVAFACRSMAESLDPPRGRHRASAPNWWAYRLALRELGDALLGYSLD